MKIWVDLYAPPDPYFFRPIIEQIRLLGHQVLVTSRDYNETVEVARRCGLDFQIVGRHGGTRFLDQLKCAGCRIVQLASLARKSRPDVAVSFNSYSQAITAKAIGMRLVTFMDYEHHPLNHVAFRLADDVIVPDGYDAALLSRQVGKRAKVHRFEGLKEDVSVTSFTPDAGAHQTLSLAGVSSSDVLVTMRPPPEHSSYHRFDNDLFYQALAFIGARPNVKIVCLPRTRSQKERIKSYGLVNVITPSLFIDGFQLAYLSDLMVSAGGSMNREAVVLGTPAYTVFKGKMAGVDKALIRCGLLREISCAEDLPGIVLEKCEKRRPITGNRALAVRFAEICGSRQ